MAIKDILVHMGSPVRANGVELAARLAAGFDAHLVGLHVGVRPEIPPYIEAQLGAEVMDMQVRAAEAEEAKAQALFDAVTAAGGLSSEWRVAQGDLVETVQLHGRYADVVVVGQANPDDPGPAGGEDIAGRLVLSVGRPVLCVPYAGTFEGVGKRVLVAWDGGRAAARALGDGLAFLRHAEEVGVLCVTAPGDAGGHGEAPGMDITAHLARHGVKATAQHISAGDIEVGAMLLSRAADFGADLMVMGAYGHARWRELVLGGVTRHMLDHMTVPVLMAH